MFKRKALASAFGDRCPISSNGRNRTIRICRFSSRINRLAKKFKELVLYHEVSVFDADASAQYFEYINCHPKTGVMRAL